MSAATAKVIDFQAYRSARLALQPATTGSMATASMPVMVPMAWVPFWFVPIVFTGVGQPAA